MCVRNITHENIYENGNLVKFSSFAQQQFVSLHEHIKHVKIRE